MARKGKRYKVLAIHNQPDYVENGSLPDLENQCENQAEILTLEFLQKELLGLSQFCSAPLAQRIFDLLHSILVQVESESKKQGPNYEKHNRHAD